MFVLVFFIANWYLSLFCQTFFLHRYAAHRMFTMSKGWEWFFRIFSYLMQGSAFLSPRAYAILHRLHHKYSDTEQDPHSPIHNTNPVALMWHTRVEYGKWANKEANPEGGLGKNLVPYTFIDRLGESALSRVGWGVAYLAVYVGMIMYFDYSWFWLLLWPMTIASGPLHGLIVNWCGHMYGYTNFKNGDHSKNTLPMDLLLMGELFQNNHHKYGGRPNFAVKWFEFDPTYLWIKLFNWVGIIKLRKQDPTSIF